MRVILVAAVVSAALDEVHCAWPDGHHALSALLAGAAVAWIAKGLITGR